MRHDELKADSLHRHKRRKNKLNENAGLLPGGGAMTALTRDEIIDRAREKYIMPGITNNITDALALYLKNDAPEDEQIPIWIITPEIHQMREILKQIRPRCDECGEELYLKTGAVDPHGVKYRTAWLCKNCEIEYYSDKSPAEWLEELQDEARK